MAINKEQAINILKSREIFEDVDKRVVKVQHVHFYDADENPRWIVSLQAMAQSDAMKAKKYLKSLSDDEVVDTDYLKNYSVNVYKKDLVPTIGSKVIAHIGWVKDKEENDVLRATSIEAIPMSGSKKFSWDDDDDL